MTAAAVRRFWPEDQDAFAAFSGDRNPIHLDDLAARRTQAGAAVVHGVHGLLWALDVVARDIPLEGLCAISARFNRFIHLGAEAEVIVRTKGDQRVVDIVAGGQAATTVKLKWGPPRAPALDDALFPQTARRLGEYPDNLSFAAMAHLSGRVALAADSVAERMFPALSAALGAPAAAAIAAASGVVGMSCPGLHSLFSQLDLHRVEASGALDPAAAGLGWRTARTDARARWVVLDLAGAGWEGAVISLARAEPVASQSMASLAQRVEPDAFAGRKALVIGGSRGLGAVTAKLIAAGGGGVVLTYARGAQDAHAVAEEIRQARGPGACAVRQCDVTSDVAQALDGVEGITHLYYFATSLIAQQKTLLYDRDRLADFMAVYVDGFAAVWDALASSRPLTGFYPSTAFLDERPRGMTEYLMAKAAAEQLCADLGRGPQVSITAPRIPRVLTDQTATSPPVPAEDALEVMLPLLLGQAG